MGAGVIGGFAKMAEALTITSVDPEKGPVAGGQEVMITGDFGELIGVKQISAGVSSACALDTAGQVYCWGRNFSGSLGDNSIDDRLLPVAVNTTATGIMNGKTITQIAANNASAFDHSHTCALDTAGQVYCWGYNAVGQLGFDSNTGPETICIDATSNPMVCSTTPVAVNTTAGTGDMDGKTIIQIAAGGYHNCALDIAGQVYCWGANNYGQLGVNTNTGPEVCSNSIPCSRTPVAVDTTSGTGAMNGKFITQITAGNVHTCALDTVGQVYCWGYNNAGLLGDNSASSRNTPVAVDTTSGTGAMNGKVITQISANNTSTCALDIAGQVYCWGSNSRGQLGVNTNTGPEVCSISIPCSRTPVAVDTTSGTGAMNGKFITQIAVGGNHTCALDITGQIYCWGRNSSGELGVFGSSSADILTPVLSSGGTAAYSKVITQITAGNSFTCARDVAGNVYCWGGGLYGNHGCIQTIYDGTGSALPGLGCNDYELTVTMNADGTPAPCTNVVIAADGKSLKCTTSAHIAGLVDVTVDDGVSAKTLEKGYEYVRDGGGGSLIKDILSPDTGVGRVVGLLVLGEVVVVAVGIAIFFKIRKEEFR